MALSLLNYFVLEQDVSASEVRQSRQDFPIIDSKRNAAGEDPLDRVVMSPRVSMISYVC